MKKFSLDIESHCISKGVHGSFGKNIANKTFLVFSRSIRHFHKEWFKAVFCTVSMLEPGGFAKFMFTSVL